MASLPDAEKLCEQLARELKAQVKASTAMVGIYTGGACRSAARRARPG